MDYGFLSMDNGFLSMDNGFLNMDNGFLNMDDGFLNMDYGFRKIIAKRKFEILRTRNVDTPFLNTVSNLGFRL